MKTRKEQYDMNRKEFSDCKSADAYFMDLYGEWGKKVHDLDHETTIAVKMLAGNSKRLNDYTTRGVIPPEWKDIGEAEMRIADLIETAEPLLEDIIAYHRSEDELLDKILQHDVLIDRYLSLSLCKDILGIDDQYYSDWTSVLRILIPAGTRLLYPRAVTQNGAGLDEVMIILPPHKYVISKQSSIYIDGTYPTQRIINCMLYGTNAGNGNL